MWNISKMVSGGFTLYIYLVSDVKAKQYSICNRKGNYIEGQGVVVVSWLVGSTEEQRRHVAHPFSILVIELEV